MNKPIYTAIVVVITIIATLAVQDIWQHFHPAAPQANRHVQTPLSPPDTAAAQQAARDFFTAMQNSDWDAVAKFWPEGPGVNKKFDDIFTSQIKDLVSGLEIVSIGTPYREPGNGWTMIPYEVQFKGGGSQKNNLRMQKQPDGHWIWGGGF